jgi:hypothetical protein
VLGLLAMAVAPLPAAIALVGVLGLPALARKRRSAFDRVAGTTVIAWDRDAHEERDPRLSSKRPRSLGMLSGILHPSQQADAFVVPDERPTARPEGAGPAGAERRPTTTSSPSRSRAADRRAQ